EKGLNEELPKRMKEVEAALAAKDDKKAPPQYSDQYSRQAIKLLTDTNGCYQCHSIGSRFKEGAQGATLALEAGRIRPQGAVTRVGGGFTPRGDCSPRSR